MKSSVRCNFSAFLACLAACAVSGCHDATFHNMYSTAQEQQIGQQVADQINSTEMMDNSPADNSRVQTIAQAIFNQARKMRSGIPYQIKIIDSPEVNAFSLPGGYVYIYTGLLDKIGNDDDALAAIIGHESAHVVLRHAVKQMSDQDIKGTLVGLIGLSTNSATLYNAAGTVYQLEQLHYSREDEYQADKYGLEFAYNAGYDPQGMIRLFDKLGEVEKATGTEPQYAADHPITKTRRLRALELIKELRTNDGKYPDQIKGANDSKK